MRLRRTHARLQSFVVNRRIAERNWREGRDGLIWFIWFIWFVLFFWLVSFNQTNQIDQTNKRNKPFLALHAPRPVALTDFFSILLERTTACFDPMLYCES